ALADRLTRRQPRHPPSRAGLGFSAEHGTQAAAARFDRVLSTTLISCRFMASVFRDGLLQGKVAFVTGGGSGIGQRIAERFAEHGAKVMLAGRKQDKLDTAAAGIRERGGHAETS